VRDPGGGGAEHGVPRRPERLGDRPRRRCLAGTRLADDADNPGGASGHIAEHRPLLGAEARPRPEQAIEILLLDPRRLPAVGALEQREPAALEREQLLAREVRGPAR